MKTTREIRGKVRGNVIELENGISLSDGRDVIVIELDHDARSDWNYKARLKALENDRFVVPTTERGKDPDRYLRELRENDRV